MLLTVAAPFVAGSWFTGRSASKVEQATSRKILPTDGTFYLDYNGNGAWDGCGIDSCLSMGLNGDTPVVEKW
jgi:hypothetical protein